MNGMPWSDLEPLVQSESQAVQEAVRDAIAPDRRQASLHGLAEMLGPRLADLTARLLNSDRPLPVALGLRLVAERPEAMPSLRRLAMAGLKRRDVRLEPRCAAAAGLLTIVPAQSRAAENILRQFAAGLRRRDLQQLPELCERLRHPAGLEIITREIEDREKMLCPRCGVTRRRRAMRRHLWNRHQLVLESRRALTPAQALDLRLVDADPQATLTAFHRELLATGLRDSEAKEHLVESAARNHESLCPYCFAATPRPEPPLPQPADWSPGRLAATEARITWQPDGSTGRWVVESDDASWAVEGHSDPAGVWIRRVSLGCAALAVPAAALLPTHWHLLTALGLVGEAAVLHYWASRVGDPPSASRGGVVDAAWRHLIPKLPAGLDLTRLALASIGHGDRRLRAPALHEAIATTEGALLIGAGPAETPAALWALAFADDPADPVLPAVDRLTRCWEGELPLSTAAAFAEWLPASPAEWQRVQILADERAFFAGLSVWDLAEIGRQFPALGRLIGSDDLDGLARRRLVWFDRTDKPWRQVGPAITVFDLARNSELPFDSGDTALLCPLPLNESLTLGGRGLTFRGAVLRATPTEITVRQREGWRGGGWDLLIGPHRFRFDVDPTPIVDRLVAWARWWFERYLARVDPALRYRSGGLAERLLRPHRVTCRSCGRPS